MKRTELAPERYRRAGGWLLASAVIGSALAVGSVDSSVLLIIGLILAVAFAMTWSRSRAIVPRPAATIIVALGVGLFTLTLAQCVPLPRSVVAMLSPHAADVWARCLLPLGEPGPAWTTLSLDPTATRIELMRGSTYILAFLCSYRISHRRMGVRSVERLVVVAGALVVLVTAVHVIASFDRLYGFYKPHTGVGMIAPMFDANHFAGYVNCSLMVAFASMVSREPIAPRPVLIAIVVLLTAVEFWVASRGAVVAAAIALIAMVAVQVKRGAADRRWLLIAGAVLPAVAIGVFLVYPTAIDLLLDRDLSKVATARTVFRDMIPQYPLFGSGRGSFESTFPEFRDGRGYYVWTHPEDLPAQWASEWGVPASAIAFLALGISLRPQTVLSGAGNVVGFWAAILAIGIQNLADFGSEIPAIPILGAVCAGAVVAGSSGVQSRWNVWGTRPRSTLGMALIMTGVAGTLVLTRSGELLSDQESARAAVLGKEPRAVVDEVLRRAMLRHPAEPYFPYLGALRSMPDGPVAVIPWIERTLERAPVYPNAHLVLARALRAAHPAQARLEYRLYAEQSTGPVLDVAEVRPLIHSFEDVMELAPLGSEGAAFLEEVASDLASRMPATRARIDEEILRRDPSSVGALKRKANDAILDAKDASWCVGRSTDCAQAAVDASIAVERAEPGRCEGYTLHARALYVSGDAEAATSMLEKARGVGPDPSECLRGIASVIVELGSDADATRAIDAVAKTTCGPSCSENFRLAADLELLRGNSGRSYVFLHRAHDADPDDESLAQLVAERASRAGLHADSLAIYSELSKRHPDDPTFSTLAEEERRHLMDMPR